MKKNIKYKILLILILTIFIYADDTDEWLKALTKNNLQSCKIEEIKEPEIIPIIKKKKKIRRVKSYPKKENLKYINYDEVGIASYYANCLNGCKTACGEKYRTNLLTAAHRTLPFGTLVCVTLLSTGKQVVVKVNDRGPYAKRRVIDLSFKAAQKIGLIQKGVSKVSIKIVK